MPVNCCVSLTAHWAVCRAGCSTPGHAHTAAFNSNSYLSVQPAILPVHKTEGSMVDSCKYNGAVLPLSAAPVGRGADGLDAMA
jgi:hypothetical protein